MFFLLGNGGRGGDFWTNCTDDMKTYLVTYNKWQELPPSCLYEELLQSWESDETFQ